MEDIIEAIIGFFLRIFRSIARGFHTLFLLAEAIVSRPARHRLKLRWESGASEQVGIIAGSILGIIALILTTLLIRALL